MEGKGNFSDNAAKRPKGFGVRHFQVMLFFCGLTIAFALRVNLSVGIVAMTDHTINPDFETFDWPADTKGLILSSFFWGYVVSQIPAGLLSAKFGPKIILLASMLLCAVLTMITAPLASLGWEVVCASRAIQGLCQGCVYPCVHTLLSKWVNPAERGLLASITYSGAQFGVVIMNALSGVIAASSAGWPTIFYFSGALAILWCAIWFWFGSNSPAEYGRVSKEERDYLEQTSGTSTHHNLPLPWGKVFTSVPFLALMIVHCGHNFGYYTLLTEIPSFMSHVLKFDIKENALLSALPYLVMIFLGLGFSLLSDFLMNRDYITVTAGRKIFNSIGHWTPMACLIGLGYVTQDHQVLGVALLTISVSFSGATNVGYLVNHMDLSPNFAGTLMGITNGVGNLMSIIGPLIVGYIISPDEEDASLWRIVFFITAGFYLVGNLVFVIFGSGRIQKWNSVPNAETHLTAPTTLDAVESNKGQQAKM